MGAAPPQASRRFLGPWQRTALLLFGVWLVLYIPHLRTNPAWYGDETLTLMIGRSLFAGDGADRALSATFWHPSYSYQPGYAWLVGLAAFLFGGDILGARLFNAVLALIISFVLAFGARRIVGRGPALLGALVFLTYQQTIIHFRWIYPHNAVALGFLICVLSLLRKSSSRADWTAGAGLALATLSHPLFVHGALAAWACRLKRPLSWIRMALLPAGVLGLGILWTLTRQHPHLWVFDDMKTLGAFYGQFSRDNGSGLQPLWNFLNFYRQDLFHMLTVISVLLCCNRRLYPIPLFLAIVSGLLLQNRQNLPVFYYQAVVFLPVMALSWAGACHVIQRSVRRRLGNGFWIRGILYASFVFPLVCFIQNAPLSLEGRLVPRNHPWVTQNPSEVEEAARWINSRTSAGDLVICHQNVGWLLKCRTADFMQATAWSGRPTFTFEKLPEHERFLFPADLNLARFVVIGDIDQRWTLAQPNVSWILEEMSKNQWPIVWKGANYIIVARPDNSLPK